MDWITEVNQFEEAIKTNILSRKITLLCEYPVSNDEFEKLRDDLFKLHQSNPKILFQYPSLVSLLLVELGYRCYKQGDYWTPVKNLFHVISNDNLLNFINNLSNTFQGFLKSNNLPTFRNIPGHCNITPILAHCGIPEYCLNDYFNHILIPIATGKWGIEFDDIDEIRDEIKNRNLYQVDKPVQRFLINGGKFAQDFIDRTVIMAKDTLELLYENNLYLPPENGFELYKIPKRIYEKYVEYFINNSDILLDLITNTCGIIRKPKFILDPDEEVLRIIIPTQKIKIDSGSPNIYFEFDNVPQQYELKILYKDSEYIHTEEYSHVINYPFKHITIRFSTKNSSKDIKKWEYKDIFSNPLFFEYESGILIKDEIRDSSCWVLIPDNYHLDTVKYQSFNVPIQLSGNWNRYSILDINISDQTECIEITSNNADTIRKSVFNSYKLVFDGGSRIDSLNWKNNPVYSKLPNILIKGMENKETWDITIRNFNENKYYKHYLSNFNQIELEDTIPEGKYQVYIKGSIGTDTRISFLYLPEFNLSFDKKIYFPEHNCLYNFHFNSNKYIVNSLVNLDPKSDIGDNFGDIYCTYNSIPIQISLHGQIYSYKCQLTFPRITIELKNRSSNKYFELGKLFSCDEYLAQTDLYLDISYPEYQKDVNSSINIFPEKQKIETKIRNGRIISNLVNNQLNYLIRNSTYSSHRITLDIFDKSIELLNINVYWLPENVKITEQSDGFNISWINPVKDDKYKKDIRIWMKDYPHKYVKNYYVGREDNILIHKNDLPRPGNYLIEFAYNDSNSWEVQQSYPNIYDSNSFRYDDGTIEHNLKDLQEYFDKHFFINKLVYVKNPNELEMLLSLDPDIYMFIQDASVEDPEIGRLPPHDFLKPQHSNGEQQYSYNIDKSLNKLSFNEETGWFIKIIEEPLQSCMGCGIVFNSNVNSRSHYSICNKPKSFIPYSDKDTIKVKLVYVSWKENEINLLRKHLKIDDSYLIENYPFIINEWETLPDNIKPEDFSDWLNQFLFLNLNIIKSYNKDFHQILNEYKWEIVYFKELFKMFYIQ